MADREATDRFPVACFAPDLTEEKLESYEEIVDSYREGPVKDACSELLKMVYKWWDMPESEETPKTRPILHKGVNTEFSIIPFSNEQVDNLWDYVPWRHELDGMKTLFDSIPPDERIRDVAFHLLWFGYELTVDREPLTQSKLPTV